MKSLVNQLLQTGLLPHQIECSLFTIEEWLADHYPVMAVLYHKELMKELMLEIDRLNAEHTRHAA